MRTLRGGAGALVVEDHGTGPLPVVLIHGMAGDVTFWHPCLTALGAERRLIVPELRGHGRSAPPNDGDYSIASCAADLLGVLEQLDIARYVLVGHSFGASIAIEMAAQVPHRVAGLVSIDGAGDFTRLPERTLAAFVAGLTNEESYANTVEGAFDVALEGSQSATERMIRAAILAAPRPMVRAVYHELLQYRPLAALDRYPGPVLLITAPANAADFSLHALRPKLKRWAMTGVSHWIMLDDPDGLGAALDGFLCQLDG